MENSKNIKKVELGNPIHLEEFVAVARYGAQKQSEKKKQHSYRKILF